jgi:hypothetical protein
MACLPATMPPNGSTNSTSAPTSGASACCTNRQRCSVTGARRRCTRGRWPAHRTWIRLPIRAGTRPWASIRGQRDARRSGRRCGSRRRPGRCGGRRSRWRKARGPWQRANHPKLYAARTQVGGKRGDGSCVCGRPHGCRSRERPIIAGTRAAMCQACSCGTAAAGPDGLRDPIPNARAASRPGTWDGLVGSSARAMHISFSVG